jgi:hypothetical protein
VSFSLPDCFPVPRLRPSPACFFFLGMTVW